VTHRDAVGAIVDPWVTAAVIAEAAGIDTMDPVAWLHKYVSSDPHVAVAGTPSPVAIATGSLEASPGRSVQRIAPAPTRSASADPFARPSCPQRGGSAFR
jgi:hypothetical protein